MRPTHPAAHRVADLADQFALDLTGASPDAVEITGVSLTSADIEPGDLFAALAGAKAHGARFAAAAVDSGATAVLTDPAGAAQLADEGVAARVPVLVADDPRALVGPLAAEVHGHPAQRLVTVGVTGTNGKTTTTYFTDAALRAAHATTVLLGTVEARIGDESLPAKRTTIEAPALQAVLARALELGAGSVAMEVSSHALVLGRVRGTVFDVAGFTNLQKEHLDFHGDMEGYFRDKKRLFQPEQARRGVVLVDDEWGRRLAVESAIPVETVSTYVSSEPSATADWVVESIEPSGAGSAFVLRGPDGVRHEATAPLPGQFNVSNAALAIVLAHAAGVPLDAAIGAVAQAGDVPGRMERVVERGDGMPLCLVDFAHTPDAMVLAIEAVRPMTPGRLFLVFGSDGERESTKRPVLGEIAGRLADVVFVTDENPRSEVPADIRGQILSGVRVSRPSMQDVVEATTRTQAIRDALAMADEADTVLVTGKGHEPYQEIAGVFHPYNDRDVLRAVRDERLSGLSA